MGVVGGDEHHRRWLLEPCQDAGELQTGQTRHPDVHEDRVDLFLVHAEQQQPLAAGADEPGVAAARREQQLLLRRVQLRRVHAGDELALAHRVAERAHVELLDPALGARLGREDQALVDLDRAGRVEAVRERAACHRRGAHAEVLRHARVDLHDALGRRARRRGRVALLDELHAADRAVAGFIADHRRMHRADIGRIHVLFGVLANCLGLVVLRLPARYQQQAQRQQQQHADTLHWTMFHPGSVYCVHWSRPPR